jgi:lipid-binding SYLF domain-containing protein
MTRISCRSLVLAGMATVGIGLAACNNTTGPASTSVSRGAATTSSLDADAKAALDALYRQQPGTRKLADQARAVLVFPTITQAGLGVGGLYGDGVMFENGAPAGRYNIAGGTFGYQIGAQSFSQAYFFHTDEALRTFRDTLGFQAGANATAVAASFGANGEISTETLQKPVAVVTWGQSGLMAGAVLQGAKITRINP